MLLCHKVRWLCLALCFFVAVPAARAARWIVRWDASAQKSLIGKQDGILTLKLLRKTPWAIVQVDPSGDTFVRALRAKGTLIAEPDQKITLAALPNDPLLSSQAFVQPANADADIHLPEAWDLQTSAPTPVVAIVDSGIDVYHPDLYPNLWRNTAELNGALGVDDDANGYVDDYYGWNVLNDDGNVTDTLFHGTHVSGVVGARGSNGIGIAGVCWQASILPARCFDPTHSDLSDALQALDYVYQNPDVRVINTSWGETQFSQALQDSIAQAGSQGIIIVAAAGNSGQDISTNFFYPASFNLPNVIAVAGIEADGNLWDTATPGGDASSYGSIVAIAAPASPVFSTRIGGYLADSGTSYAAPHVVGAIALLLQRDPTLTPADIKARLIATSTRTMKLSSKPLGGGLLNVRNFLQPILPARHWQMY